MKNVGQVPSCERFCSAGLLAELKTVHTEAGGQDPTSTTRANLLENGAPIKAARHAPTENGAGKIRAHILYANSKTKKRRRMVGRITKVQRREEQKRCGEEWKAMPPEAQQSWIDMQDELKDPSRTVPPPPKADDISAALYQQRAGDRLWHKCSLRQPFTADAFDATLKGLRVCADGERCGITSYKERRCNMGAYLGCNSELLHDHPVSPLDPAPHERERERERERSPALGVPTHRHSATFAYTYTCIKYIIFTSLLKFLYLCALQGSSREVRERLLCLRQRLHGRCYQVGGAMPPATLWLVRDARSCLYF